jgi:hypothetical protein
VPRTLVPVGGARLGQPMELLISGVKVRIDADMAGKMVARCPRCDRRCRYLYTPDVVCRRCGGARWASTYPHCPIPYSLMARIQRWRRSIHQDPTPFSPLVRRPRGRRRVQRVMRRIMAAETELLAVIRQRNDALERRIANGPIAGRRKRKPTESAT